MRIVREDPRIAEVRGGLFHVTWRGWRLEVPHGQVIPFPYGIAYRDVDARTGVCVPIPFNWVFRWAIAVVTWLRFPNPERGLDRLLRDAYRAGYRNGLTVGLDGSVKALDELSTETLVEILRARIQQGARES